MPGIEEADLAPTEPITYRARDGLLIDGYLTVPDLDADRWPLVVFPHGGPALRDQLEFNPFVQFMANRGFAVLQMNYRGSSGYGRRHKFLGHGQWGRAIQDDIADGVDWAVREGIADPARICIVGGSFGGYAALMGPIRDPQLYRCAASINGVTDVVRWLRETKRDGRFATLEISVGDPNRDGPELRAHSPLLRASEIEVPVMIAYGDADQVVSPRHSERMADALRRAGNDPVELRLRGGGHNLANSAHRMRLLQALEGFLNEHLGDRTFQGAEVEAAAGFSPGPTESRADLTGNAISTPSR